MRTLKIPSWMSRVAWTWSRSNRPSSVGPHGKPRLLIDVSVIVRRDAQTGIQRVVRAVWSELIRKSLPDVAIVPVYANSKRGYCYAPEDFLDADVGCLDAVRVFARPGDKFLGLDLSAHVLPLYRRQLQTWREAGASVHLVVYDLLPMMVPQFFERSTVRRFRRWFDVLAKNTDQAICISRQVGRDLRSQLQLHGGGGPSVAYLKIGCDMAASRPSTGISDQVLSQLDRMRFRPTVLMVGTIEPRKAYDVALSAFEHLWNTVGGESPDLLIVGKPGWKTDALQDRLTAHPENGRRLHWLSGISDEGLCRLYVASKGVLMTSYAEGFGLPLIEAANYGRPILARDLAVFREHGLPNVHYFEDDCPEKLGDAVLEMLTMATSPAANLPTWSESVEGLLSVLDLERTTPVPLPREAQVVN